MSTSPALTIIARDNYFRREIMGDRAPSKTPQRSRTHHDYKIPLPPAKGILISTDRTPSPGTKIINDDVDYVTSRPAVRGSGGPMEVGTPRGELVIPRRPTYTRARRSYSVMDYEPEPHTHRLSAFVRLEDLPSDIHYNIFDQLDPIDSTCLGLTSRYFYAIHRRLRGTVRLSARRDGPNDLEWAWHRACAVIKASPRPFSGAALLPGGGPTNILEEGDKSVLAKLRVRGQGLCRKCGITRCELHKHIRHWMGCDEKPIEYCAIRDKFVDIPADPVKVFCYMSSPRDPQRCGRHRTKKSKVILQ